MKPFVPQTTKYPRRSVVTITAVGAPRSVFPKIMPSLYGTAYGTKFKVFKPQGKIMEIGHLVCAYPNAHRQPMAKWKIVCQLEISNFVKQHNLLQKQPKFPVKLERQPAGLYAEILHIGPYSKEGSAIKQLHHFINAQKLKIIGPHEEVYLSRPGPKAKTIIRYLVTRK